uniref:Uncharacterized protein n=1 Tax=Chromera velia CCMP2878 TaxID=1169474 RepID=A0A0G4FJM0_9ALVE|eukprot:Cvel_3422.t1-p1 / transcript=Cvel_3422.t1 / gene=Cvel_3422 / organism=Chromera_velia_CCMP2878 / gene_product=hypothetical protein / transcript_product=hypothetical protein / location=Cvel_scaffold137:92808-101564(+) / protein_length=456 / sequence_SO=supercontig / SO=protein_coding / is_pseudo=false
METVRSLDANAPLHFFPNVQKCVHELQDELSSLLDAGLDPTKLTEEIFLRIYVSLQAEQEIDRQGSLQDKAKRRGEKYDPRVIDNSRKFFQLAASDRKFAKERGLRHGAFVFETLEAGTQLPPAKDSAEGDTRILNHLQGLVQRFGDASIATRDARMMNRAYLRDLKTSNPKELSDGWGFRLPLAQMRRSVSMALKTESQQAVQLMREKLWKIARASDSSLISMKTLRDVLQATSSTPLAETQSSLAILPRRGLVDLDNVEELKEEGAVFEEQEEHMTAAAASVEPVAHVGKRTVQHLQPEADAPGLMERTASSASGQSSDSFSRHFPENQETVIKIKWKVPKASRPTDAEFNYMQKEIEAALQEAGVYAWGFKKPLGDAAEKPSKNRYLLAVCEDTPTLTELCDPRKYLSVAGSAQGDSEAKDTSKGQVKIFLNKREGEGTRDSSRRAHPYRQDM